MPYTPGVDRVIVFEAAGHQFGLRRPSRADAREIAARWAAKLAAGGAPDLLAALDGDGLLWEARFEVLLVPRRVQGTPQPLGEHAPVHWLVDGEDGPRVSFERVDAEEFAAVCAAAEQAWEQKKTTSQSSTDSAASQSSA